MTSGVTMRFLGKSISGKSSSDNAQTLAQRAESKGVDKWRTDMSARVRLDVE